MNALAFRLSRVTAFVLTAICLCANAYGQPTASFSASQQNGCSPLLVHFTDLSAGNPTQWRWDLGNGVSSTLKNPSATYFNPGSYTIKLVVKNQSGADSVVKQNHITVYANPVVQFTAADTTGCFPKPIQFHNASTAGSGTISSWHWDFGDGATSTLKNPVHVYQSAGMYNVTLKVTNSHGCTKTLSRTQYISITAGITADFNVSSSGLCAAPAVVQFQNGVSAASYFWDFGDGQTSTLANPSHQYNSNGNYAVRLIATGAAGCSDTVVKQVRIGAASGFAAPDTVCVNAPVSFTNTSAPAPSSVKWKFGDGSSSTQTNPIKSFAAPGVYTVTLVNRFGACSDSVSKTIVVSGRPRAVFSAAQTQFCKTPATVQFQSQSVGAVSHLWLFGDGTSSGFTHPTHTYQATGNYTVTLIVTNAAGCTDTLKKNNFVSVQKPQIQITGLPRTGCVPVTVQPSAHIVSNQPVQGYLWKFGDGTTSTDPNPTHVYNTAGNYDLTLVIVTAGGCTDSVKMVNAVRAGNKPKANFVAMPPEVCNVNPVQFIDSSEGNPDQWLWIFGDSLMSTAQNPSHVFDNIGRFTVTLVVWNNTCPDTITKPNVVNVLPPLSLFSFEQSCTDKYRVKFKDESVGATHVVWDFGDNTTATQRFPEHIYAAPGTYTVVYKVYNNNCWNINWRKVRIIDEKAAIVASATEICKGTPVQLAAPSVTDSNIVSWHWNFGDGGVAGTPSAASHTYTKAGNFTAVLTIKDLNGCISSDSVQIKVYGPSASFTTSASAACLSGNQISFDDQSVTDGLHSITKRIWHFDDGSADSSGANPVQHHYQNTGSYNISYFIQDAFGCVDQVTKPAAVVVAQPLASFTSADTLSCTGKAIVFNNSSMGSGLSYQWSFGDGNGSSALQPQHSYQQTGHYTVTLQVKDQYGCSDSMTRTSFVHISLPEAKFMVSDSTGNCPPLIVHFTNASTAYTSLRWEFGDGNASVLANPVHFYNTAGVFYARLIATGPGGCTDTAVQKIVVKGPSGTFSYSPVAGCDPLTVNFQAQTQNTSSLVWDFGDGNTITGTGHSVTHTYNNTGELVPRIILADAAGCHVPIMGADTIRVFGVKAGFTLTENTFCGPALVQLTNTTVSNDLVTQYYWHFGDGSTMEANPSHQYQNPGTYKVQLVAVTANGCTDSIAIENAVTVLQKPSVRITGDSAACVPASIALAGILQSGDAVSWQWDFGNGQTASGQAPQAPSYGVEGNYSVRLIAKASNGCQDTAGKNIHVWPLPATHAGPDQLICKGSVAQLQATGAESYQWHTDASLSCTGCQAPLAAPQTTNIYVVTGRNSFGCTSKDSVVISVQQPPHLQVGPGDTVCVGTPVLLTANGADHYNWLPATGVKDPNAAVTMAVPSTTTTYKVVGRDKNNCFTDTASVFIKVWPIPAVDAGPDQNLVVGQSLQLIASGSPDVSQWKWNQAHTLSCAACATTMAKPKQTTTYTVQVKNDGGCTAQDDITVNVICNNGNLFVPNSFSPNGDGVNDRFFPSGSGIGKIKTFRVFNRWGEVVFEKQHFAANDASMGWDGLFKGQTLPPDVYIWSCEVICQNNETLSFKGDVALLR